MSYFMPQYGYYPDTFGYGYGWQLNGDAAVPPPAPPGYAWVDIGAVGTPLPPYTPWATMQAWNPAPAPSQADIPGTVFKNAHGTLGLDLGYNYLFPKEHCKIHVLISDLPPWEAGAVCQKRCFDVPCSITVKELMQQFGCDNPKPAKNWLYEVSQAPSGQWYKGFEVNGSDKEKMSKSIKEVGWNSKRNGIDQDFVWLYFAKG